MEGAIEFPRVAPEHFDNSMENSVENLVLGAKVFYDLVFVVTTRCHGYGYDTGKWLSFLV